MGERVRVFVCRGDVRGWPIFGLTLAALVAAIAPPVRAATLPTGGAPRAGSVVIGAVAASSLTVTQSSSRAIIDWSSFSIGAGGGVRFDNGAGATLNRVTGGSLSAIDGLLSATGSVYLINPNGVIIGKSGVVTTGGTFVASTLDVADSAFTAGGDLTFAGSTSAMVINYGRIGASGGDVALIASRVENDGEIDAAEGDVGLAAGLRVVLRDAALDGGRFSILLGGAATSATNAGVIRAAEAELRANGGNVYALAGNTGGLIEATGVSANGGKVFLVAEGGMLSLAGAIEASGANGAGGQIETSGATVDIGKTGLSAGKGGSWLLDPVDLTIDQTAADTIAGTLDAGPSVTQQTNASGVGGNGDIFVASNVSLDWTTAAGLTLSAYRNIGLGAGARIASTGGGAVTLRADNTGDGVGTVSFAAGAGVATAGAVSIFYNPSVNPAGSGVNTTSYVNPTETYAANVSGGGALTAYMLVNTVNDLQNIQNNLTGTYALGADIDAGATSGWNAGAGFSPVGGNAEPQFTGTFEGNGHTISNLFIDYTTPYPQTSNDGFTALGVAGLFGVIGGAGIVRDVALTNANVSAGAGMTVGALVGAVVTGQVLNDSSSGVVSGLSAVGANSSPGVGGLVGSVLDGGSISTSSSSAQVTGGNGEVVGGLVGSLVTGSTLTWSYATGNVAVGGPINGPIFQYAEAGGLIGTIYGYHFGAVNPLPVTVSHAYATGAVSGAGGSFVGGFVGAMDQGTISASYATGQVTQTGVNYLADNDIGGFVGYVGGGATVTQSYASGAVATVGAPNIDYVTLAGGFAGVVNNYGAINNAYSLSSVLVTGPVNGAYAGGFVGLAGAGSIDDVYATGRVAGGVNAGGLAGILNGVSLTNSYWDEGTTGLTNAYCCGSGGTSGLVGIGGSTGLSPYLATTYANIDLTASGAWVIVNGATRPLLLMEYATTITSAHQLQLMALDPTATYTLAANIDLSTTATAADIWNPATGFVPIGGNVQAQFTGTLEGNGHTISNLFINSTTPDPQTSADGFSTNGLVGLFGAVGATGAVRDVVLANANVNGGAGMTVGALVGGLVGGALSNDSSAGSVSGLSGVGANASTAVGGLVGVAQDGASITGSSSSAQVTGGNGEVVGGLAGAVVTGASLTFSYATGDVATGSPIGSPITQFAEAGGLIGVVYGYHDGGVNPIAVTVGNDYATGAVSGLGGAFVGGFVGAINQGTVSESYATGTVVQTGALATSNDIIGGFAGYVGAGGVVTQSYASGAVSAAGGANPAWATLAGGFAGDIEQGGAVNNAYAVGSVSVTPGFDIFGGFVGYEGPGGSVTQAYDTGHVSGSGDQGGVAGYITNGSLTDVYWDEGTTGEVNAYCCGAAATQGVVGVGGSTGISPYATATYAGFDFTNTWAPPSAGYYPELYGVSHVLRVTPDSATSVYGNPLPVFSASYYGLQGGDTSSVVSGLSYSVIGATVSPTGFDNAGAYAIAGLGANAADTTGVYRIVYANGALNITPRALNDTLIGTAAKVYNGATKAALTNANYTPLTGVLARDKVSMGKPGVGAYASKDVGAGILVTATGVTLTGAQAGDYTVTASGDIGTITPKTVTAAFFGTLTKVYDGTTAGTLTAASTKLTGKLLNDTVSVVGTTTYASRNVGTGIQVTVTGASLTGPQALDYTLSNSSFSGLVGTTTKRALTASLIGAVVKAYDGTTTAFLSMSNYLLTGVEPVDLGLVALNDPTTGMYGTAAKGAGKNVYVTGLALLGPDAGDYSVNTMAKAPIGTID